MEKQFSQVMNGLKDQAKLQEKTKPSYYRHIRGDVIDFAFQHGFGKQFCIGNIVKYLVRAGKKPDNPEINDLMKAREYLDRLIEEVANESND